MPNVENHVDEGGDKSEVVVTEAMVEAGLSAVYDYLDSPEEFRVREILTRAMKVQAKA